jgi:hypothetical protein
VQQIEDAIGQHDTPAGPPQVLPPGNRRGQISQFWVVEIHSDASLTIPSRM